jgi:hypothetical protein
MLFDALDADADGVITRHEMRTGWRRRLCKHVTRHWNEKMLHHDSFHPSVFTSHKVSSYLVDRSPCPGWWSPTLTPSRGRHSHSDSTCFAQFQWSIVKNIRSGDLTAPPATAIGASLARARGQQRAPCRRPLPGRLGRRALDGIRAVTLDSATSSSVHIGILHMGDKWARLNNSLMRTAAVVFVFFE